MEFVPLIAGPDQRPGRRPQGDRGQDLRPRPGEAPRAGREGRRGRREDRRDHGRQLQRPPGQPRHRHPPRQRPDGAGRPDRDGRRVAAQRRALRPGGQHDPRAGPDDQDPRPLPGPHPVSTASSSAELPISLATAIRGPPVGHRLGRRLRPARAARHHPGRAQRQRTLAGESAARHHRRGPSSSRTADLGRGQPGDHGEGLGDPDFPPGYRWELAGTYRASAGVVRQPDAS